MTEESERKGKSELIIGKTEKGSLMREKMGELICRKRDGNRISELSPQINICENI